jgi:hypothetical protein
MRVERKQRLKKRDQKLLRQETKKYEVYDRVLRFLGIQSIFSRLPTLVVDLFLNRMRPGVEVVAAEDVADHPAIREARREIAAVIKRPVQATVLDREFSLSFEDIHRGYDSLLLAIEDFWTRFRVEKDPGVRRVFEVLDEAKAVVESRDQEWFMRVLGKILLQVIDVTERDYRFFGDIIEVRLVHARKPEGRLCDRLELRLHRAESAVISHRGRQATAYPVRRADSLFAMRQVRWNCRKHGIEGPNIDLPVMISEHAIRRLYERLPLHGHESYLNAIAFNSLEKPVFFRQDFDEYLVEVRTGELRVGYFVAKILPQAVLIKTFLFLTMTGTPEGQALRDKLGMSRSKIEEYKLDSFFTLMGADIPDDPLLFKIMEECGCSHLFGVIPRELRFGWSEKFGKRLKEELDLRESIGGFKIGQKWVRWSDATGLPDAETETETVPRTVTAASLCAAGPARARGLSSRA